MKAVAVTTHAIGDPKGTGEHFIINRFVEQADGIVVLETRAGWKQLKPLDGTDGKWYEWIDGAAGEVNNWNRGRVNGQVLTMNPHGDRPYAFGWSNVEV